MIATITPGRPAALNALGKDVAKSTEAPMASILQQISIEQVSLSSMLTYMADIIIVL
jgi:hypothetical protein